ncbi:DEAD-box ATP-dependent RNA helicase 1 [Sesamum alatum]|uniref:ATP-dependent RNA helicase n=1 Tax=Sesamum alatum TaxID=300844 RepID=A0AAE2CZC0_9LAMI|nr:DEAD-box ATP-dependent RNA helicase 1 [Sesamum alatum]
MEESAAEQKGRKKRIRLAKKPSKMGGESSISTRELNSSSLETMEELAAEQNKKKSLPLIPWMRDPVDISRYDSRPVGSLPFLDNRLKKALHNMGISSLFPVQVAVWQETIGPGFFERDLCINSPTGSGKTIAYALPIVQKLSTRFIKCLRALVVLPTRDLALQVKEVFDALAPAVGLSVGLAVGQSSIADEIAELIRKPTLDADIWFDSEYVPPEQRSAVDILVATPGRLMDHINNTKGFTLEHLHYLVVDETDRLLREAYQSWLPNVLKLAYSQNQNPFPCTDGIVPTFGVLKTIRSFGRGKPHPRLAKMVLSATLTQDPSKLAQLDLHYPLYLTTGQRRYQLPEQLKSFKVLCKSKLKPLYLLALLESLQGEKCIVFTSSVDSTHRLCTLLNFFDDLQIKIKEYSRLQRQSIRSKTLKAFRAGEIQVLISSDAMTRGMDVEGVKNVINYDMPPFIKTYIHRAGRTARAGQSGRCFTLLHKDEVKRFKRLLQKADNDSCPVYSVPSESVESFRSMYSTALERLKESVESEKRGKGKVKVNIKQPDVTRKVEKASLKEEESSIME